MDSHAHRYRRGALASSACNRETIFPPASPVATSHRMFKDTRAPATHNSMRRTTDMPGAEPDIGGPSLARTPPLMPRSARCQAWSIRERSSLACSGQV